MVQMLGCDIGSQGLKTVLFDANGKLIATATRSYPIEFPHPTWADQDPQHWLHALIETITEVLDHPEADRNKVKSIGLSSQVDSVIPVDKNCKPLRKAIIWMDRRSVSECDWVSERQSPGEIFQLTGLNIDASHVVPKILWIRNNEPAVYERCYKLLLPGSFILFHLTGEFAVDYSNASSTMLLDVRKRAWSNTLIEAFQIDPEKLVNVYGASEVVGKILPEVSSRTGLDPNTQVVVGSGDEHAATLGAGVVSEGYACDIVGTAEPVACISNEILFDPTRLVETHCGWDDQAWFMENPGFVSGGNYRWFRDNFSPLETKAAKALNLSEYQLMDLEAATIPPGSEGLIFLPCLMGAMVPEWNNLARGTLYGLTLKHTKAHVVRAILEASAYGLNDIIRSMERLGCKIDEIRVVGGGAQSRIWRQVKADVTKRAISLPHITETSSFGAALLGGIGVGIFKDANDAASNVVSIKEQIEPDLRAAEIYDPMYTMYRELYASVKGIFELGHKAESLLQ